MTNLLNPAKDLKELWLPVKWYEGLYEVSNWGNVRSLGKYVNHSNQKFNYKCLRPGCLLTIQKAKRGGYAVVKLSNVSEKRLCRVHRLVAEAWIDNPLLKPEVNHKDGNKFNNHVTNLEWATGAENKKHAIETGLIPNRKGVNGTPIIAYNMEGREVGRFISIREAQRQLNICGQNICSVLKGKIRYAKGHTFKYAPSPISPEAN